MHGGAGAAPGGWARKEVAAELKPEGRGGGRDLGEESSEQRNRKYRGHETGTRARRPLWPGRGSKGERGRKRGAWRGRGMKGLVSHGGSRHFMLFPCSRKSLQGSKEEDDLV